MVPFRAWGMVWTTCPFESAPDRPGAQARLRRRRRLVQSPRQVPNPGHARRRLYLTPGSKVEGTLPAGVIRVSAVRAETSGNRKPFFIDTRITAFVPLTTDFVPDINLPSSGLIAASDRGLWQKVPEEFRTLNERHREQLVSVGPFRPL